MGTLLLVSQPPAVTADDPGVVGQWSPVTGVGIVPIHASLLPDGRALFFNSTGGAKTWNPETGASVNVPSPFANVFCSGHTFMPDGKLFVAGGHVSDGEGPKTVQTFDYRTNTWARLPDMNAGRWYPTCTTLPNGDTLVITGSVNNVDGINRLPQVYQADGAVRDLDNAWLYLPLYSFMHAAPNGRVYNTGPNQRTRAIVTTGTGSYANAGDSAFGYRDTGTSVMYDNGKVLMVGGHDPPTETAEVIDLADPDEGWRTVAPLPTPRRQINGTVLPDGKVLIVGGSRLQGFNNPDGAMLTAELFDPATEAWLTTAAMQVPRLYHSTSLLMPDGRVMVGGGGEYSVSETTPHPDVEFYSPPYLFKGPRPTVTDCPSEIEYAQGFTLTTPDAADIASITCIRLGSVTHGFDMSQRRVRLAFTRGAGVLNVTAPTDGNTAPPGHYLLFALNSNGVPSMGRVVRISDEALATPPDAPSDLLAQPQSTKSVVLTWVDRASDETGFRIERSLDGVTFGLRRTVGANIRRIEDTGLVAGMTYTYRVRAYNLAGQSAPSNPSAARTLTFDPSGTGLIGEYFNAANFTNPALTRVDPQINAQWSAASPAPGVDPDTFSVRWRGDIQPRYTGTYTFRSVSDEAVTLKINGQIVIDDSSPHPERAATGTISLKAGQRYTIWVNFQEFTGASSCVLQWQSANQPLEIVPSKFLYPAGLIGTYFDNPDFTAKRLDRLDNSLAFNWGTGAPASDIRAGTYSIRWKGCLRPATTETYTFTVACSGAVRLYLDGVLILNAWSERPLTELTVSRPLTAGKKHALRVDYADTGGAAAITLSWQSATVGKQVIPRSNLLAN